MYMSEMYFHTTSSGFIFAVTISVHVQNWKIYYFGHYNFQSNKFDIFQVSNLVKKVRATLEVLESNVCM